MWKINKLLPQEISLQQVAVFILVSRLDAQTQLIIFVYPISAVIDFVRSK